jgi:hypothetical protein
MAMKTLKAPPIKKKSEVKSSISDYDERPNIRFTETELPDIKNWAISKKYKLVVEVEMNGIRKEEYGSNKGKITGDFKVIKVGVEEKE